MASPGPGAIKTALQDLYDRPNGIGSGMSRLDVIRELGPRVGVAEAVSTEGPEVAIAAEAMGEFCADLGGWLIVFTIAAIIVNGKVFEWLLTHIGIEKIPWVGIGYLAIVHAVFKPLNDLEAWTGQKMADYATGMIISFLRALRQFLQFELGTTSTAGSTALQAQVNHEQSEINDIYRRLAHQEDQIQAIQDHTGTVLITPPGYQSLNQRVTHIEHLLPTIQGDLNYAHSHISGLEHDVGLLQGQVTALRSALSGVRTETLGVQDVLDQLQQTTVNLTHDVAVLGPEVDANKRQLRFLSPLGVLLVNGSAGLKNLEKLERKPCQCSGLPGLPFDEAGFLAAYEFITNG